jgi:predicted DNA-binding transcriptional regulator AlpA
MVNVVKIGPLERPAEMTRDPLVTKKALAKRLGVSTRTIDRRRSAGDMLEPLGGAGQPRWRPDEVDAWIAAGCPKAGVWTRIRPPHRRRHP